jgi:hypothetical protein
MIGGGRFLGQRRTHPAAGRVKYRTEASALAWRNPTASDFRKDGIVADKHLEMMTRQAKLVFGAGAVVSGSMGSGMCPGHIAIAVDDVVLGVGRDFTEALRSAQRRAATLATSTGAPLAGSAA